MNNVSFNQVRAITSTMSVLYVEDDITFGGIYKEVLDSLFANVAWRHHGGEGLKAFVEADTWDLVITDITMPLMNGFEMIEALQEINNTQDIIIMSSHIEIDHLQKAIDLGVRGFINKPSTNQQFLNELHNICQKIEDKKLLQHYVETLEMTVKELNNKNKIIEKLLHEAKKNEDALLVQIARLNASEKGSCFIKSQKHTYRDVLSDDHLSELPELEDELDIFSGYLSVSSFNVNKEEIILFANKFYRYGQIMFQYHQFNGVGEKIMELTHIMKTHADLVYERRSELALYFESLAVVLSRWRKALFIEGIEDPHFFDKSLYGDIDTIIATVLGTFCDNGLEFF